LSSKFKVGDVCRTLRGHPADGHNFPAGSIVRLEKYLAHQESWQIEKQSVNYCWVEEWLELVDRSQKKSGFGKFISRVEKDASV